MNVMRLLESLLKGFNPHNLSLEYNVVIEAKMPPIPSELSLQDSETAIIKGLFIVQL